MSTPTNFPLARYDRSVSSEFISRFEAGGFAASLLDYAGAKFPIDFQFRKSPRTGKQWASLYVGMTTVLNVSDKGSKGYSLSADKKYTTQTNRWNPSWEKTRGSSFWADEWPSVEDYLERIIPIVMKGSLTSKEGPVQAAVSVFRGDPARTLLDREVTPSFIDDPTRKSEMNRLSSSLVRAVAGAGLPGKAPERYGPYCDVLAIHQDGHLEAIEIKPANVSSLAWVPAQATMYSRLLNFWIETDPDWQQTIGRMFEQRKRLGLITEGFKMPRLKPLVRPAVAFPRVADGTFVNRMFDLQKHLLTTDVGDPNLTFYRASLSGRLVPVD